jgi:hypothetical protein
MSDLLRQFQESAFTLSPVVLAGVGAGLVWLGLFLWLGGLRWLKFLAGFAAAAVGYAVALRFAGQQTAVLVVAAVIAGLVGIFLEKTVGVIVAAVLAALIVNLLLALPMLSDAKTWSDSPRVQSAKDVSPSVAESLTTLEIYGRYLIEKGIQAVQSLGNVGYTASAIAGLAVLGVGLAVPRGICALMCAIFGTAAIATGLLLLLLYKGSKPVDYILECQGMLWMIALGMVGFGMLIDLALCPGRPRKKAAPEEKQTGDKK